MNLAIVGGCAVSFGTTRKKFGIEPFVSAARVAEPEMNGSRSACMKTGATASTSWLPAGPTTASTSGSACSVFATLAACAGSSCVSPSRSLIAPPPSRADRVPREAELLLADERRVTGDRAHEADASGARTRRSQPTLPARCPPARTTRQRGRALR